MNKLKVKSEELKVRKAMRVFLRGLVSVFFLLISFSVFAQDIPARPVPPRLVNDFANVLSAKHVKMLEEKLVRFNDTTSTQICVVTIDDLGGTTTADFAYQIGERWGVGHKENNGAVILIKPKKSEADRGGVSIQVGYGLEPIITDALARRIIEQEIIPAFKVDDYYTAIDKATDVIIGLTSGQFSAEDYNNEEDSSGAAIVIFSLIFIVFVIILLGRNNKNNGGTISGKDDDSDFWRALFWASLFTNSHRNDGWGGFSGGSGGFGGGGGFGGFGGGHFGGGGASGSW